MITVLVPATTANMGPGFDCLGLALDLWNEAKFSLESGSFKVRIHGEGAEGLPKNQRNLVAAAALRAFHEAGRENPQGLSIECTNRIPLRSGLGSSCAAVLCGIQGANALMGSPFSQDEVLALAVEMEGHPDNAAAAVLGGLVITVGQERDLIKQRVEIPAWRVAVVLPQVKLGTRQARKALPEKVALSDAVSNVGRSALVVQALQEGDENLLREAMQDRLHEPYRYKLIPGAEEAITAARQAGAAAALSGAGPSVAAFGRSSLKKAAGGMQAAFAAKGIPSRLFLLTSSAEGIQTSQES